MSELTLSFSLPNESSKGKAKYKQIYSTPVLTLHPKVGKLTKLQRKCVLNDAALKVMGITDKTELGLASVGESLVLLVVSQLPAEQQAAVKYKFSTVSGSFGGTALYNKILKAINIAYKDVDNLKYNFALEPIEMDIEGGVVILYKLSLLGSEEAEKVGKSLEVVRTTI